MIDKNSLHFKIAAYSLKHPKHVYLGLGGIFIFCIVVALVIGLKIRSGSPVIQEMNIDQVSEKSTNNWVAKKKIATSDKSQCILYEHKISQDRVVNCYKKLQSGNWVYEYSY